jgi:hypothetical protein
VYMAPRATASSCKGFFSASSCEVYCHDLSGANHYPVVTCPSVTSCFRFGRTKGGFFFCSGVMLVEGPHFTSLHSGGFIETLLTKCNTGAMYVGCQKVRSRDLFQCFHHEIPQRTIPKANTTHVCFHLSKYELARIQLR